MKNQILIILLLLLSVSLISAVSVPLPHAFYGEVYYSDGSLIHENLIITAKLDGFEDTCIIQNGTYGYGEDTLIVQSENEDGTIYFYIQGLEEEIQNIPFELLNVTELNFMTSLTNPNSLTQNNDSTNNTNSGSSSSGGSSGGGGGDILNNEYNQKQSSFEGFGSLNLNENSQINSFVMHFVNYGPILTFIFLIGILILLLIIIKKKKK